MRKTLLIFVQFLKTFQTPVEFIVRTVPSKFLPSYLNLRALVRKSKDHFGFDKTNKLYFARSPSTLIRVAHPERLWLYSRGVEQRLEKLAESYCLLGLGISKGMTVVDCGANVGELGIYFGLEEQYVAIEPDPTAYRALELNLPSAICVPVALGEFEGIGDLVVATATADTHLLLPSTPVEDHSYHSTKVIMRTLDNLLNELGIQETYLIKIEAEGNEPEVLKGAKTSISNSRYVAIDCGPERDGIDTVSDCLKIMYAFGFEVINSRVTSGRFLLERVNPPQVC